VRKIPPKVSKTPSKVLPGKKKGLPKKLTKPVKPSTSKKKVPMKKIPAKPVKKPKAVSHSKSLRKKKPK